MLLGGALLGMDVLWAPPQPVAPAYGNRPSGPVPPEVEGAGGSSELLDRPLFVASRRPAPKAEEHTEPPPQPDPFKDVVLRGVYSAGEGVGGISIVDSDGVDRRIVVGKRLGDWTLSAVTGAVARFERAGEARTLKLTRTSVAAPPARPPVATPSLPRTGARVPDVPQSRAESSVSAATQDPPSFTVGGQGRAQKMSELRAQRLKEFGEARRKTREALAVSPPPAVNPPPAQDRNTTQ